MKKKYLAVMMGLLIAVSPLSSFAEDNSQVQAENTVDDSNMTDAGTAEVQEQPAAGQENGQSEQRLMGKVAEAGADYISIQMDNQVSGQGQTEEGEKQDQEESVIEVTITSETQIFKRSMGMMGGGQPGEMKGEAPGQQGEMPEKPERTDSEAPDSPEAGNSLGKTEEISLEDIQTGDMVAITLNEDGTAAVVELMSMEAGGGGMNPGGGGMGQPSGVDSYDVVKEISEDTTLDGEKVSSEGTDENAVLVDTAANVTLSDMTISRESSDSTGGDNSSFYGVGAAVLATDGTVSISDSTIMTDAAGGAGVFAYGDGTVYVADTDITTQQDTSGGIHTAGGGALYAWDVTAETNGRSAAAVRSDRGGGLMVIDGGTYTSNGPDSPAVYCTADISINNAELTANGSEAVCIEGLNTLRLYDCDLTGNMSDDDRNDNTWTVIVYQSMSGDSEIGNGTFQMEGGTLTSGNGGIFYTTNTECTITLKNVKIVGADDSGFFLQCTGNTNSRGWGQTGSNGSDCLFTGISQEMQGDVLWDSISNLQFYMTSGSMLTGAIVKDETYAGEGGDGACSVSISEDSVWIVTGDSEVSVLNCSGSIIDEEGKTVTVQGTDGTIYTEGDSEYTVTVDSYSDTADLSGAADTDTWEDHAVERPENL